MIRVFLLFLLSFFGTYSLKANGPSSQLLQPVEVQIDSVWNASCFGLADGAIFISVTQGLAPFTFEWSNGDTNSKLVDVPAGLYNVTVTDAEGDQAILENIEVLEPTALDFLVDSVAVPDCAGNAGYLRVKALGGTEPYDYEWNTGQATPIIDNLPEGDYSLTITDALGCSVEYSTSLVTDYPIAIVNALNNITCATPIALVSGLGSSQGGGIVYEWFTSGSGNIISNSTLSSITVDQPGTYELVVTNVTNGCQASASATVLLDITPPLADAGPDHTNPCTNTIDTLEGSGSAGAQFQYSWTALDGGHLSSGADSLTPVIDHSGTFALLITNTVNGCTASDTAVVNGLNEPPFAAAQADTLTCTVLSLALSAQFDTLNTVFDWTGPNAFFNDSIAGPQVTAPGSYTLTVLDTLTTCSIQALAVIARDTATPVILYTQDGTITCTQPFAVLSAVTDTLRGYSWYWTGPGGFEAFQQTVMVTAAGDYTVVVTDTLSGCTASELVTVIADTTPPVADAGADGVLNCLNATVVLDGSGSSQGPGFSYAWMTPDGQINGGASFLFPTVGTVGTYILEVTNAANGCMASDTALVSSDFAAPVASASVSDTLSCLTASVQIFGEAVPSDDVAFHWSGPGGFSSTEQNPFVSLAGAYVLTATDTLNGCSNSATVTVNTTAPIANAGTDGALTCISSTATLNGAASSQGAAYVYAWETADGHILSGDSTLTLLVDATGSYVLTVFDTVQNCFSTDTALVVLDTLAPVADAGPDGLLTCALTQIQLDGTGSSQGPDFNYQWTTADGNILSGASGLTPLVDGLGTYALLVTNLQNGCTATASTEVSGSTEMPNAFASVSGTLSCLPAPVQLQGSSTTPGATYSWEGPNGFTSAEQNPLTNTAGDYTLTVKHPVNGCTATATVTVTTNIMPPSLSATGGELTCAQPNLTLTATAQPANVIYVWSDVNGPFSTEQNPVVSASGFYTVVATNPQNGCTNSALVLVTEDFSAPTVNATAGTITCASASADLQATSPTPGLSYAWSGPNGFSSNQQNTSTTTTGYYTVVATLGGNGCSASATVFVASDSLQPAISAGDDRALECNTNMLTLAGQGPIGNQYTYSWTTVNGHFIIGENTLHPRVDEPGTYVLVITNANNGCSATDEVNVTQPVLFTATIGSVVPVGCNGEATGQATVIASGGNGIYTYQWSSGSHAATATNLVAGVYSVTVADGEGCTKSTSAQIVEPTALTLTTSATAQSMTGLNDGTATATPSGGTSPYAYLWNTGATTPGLSGLAPGAYTVTVTDANGCTAVATANVNSVPCALTGTTASTNIPCNGLSNGTASVTASGGMLPYQYHWSNGASTAAINGLDAGIYTVTVSDAAGCSIVLTATVSEPPVLSVLVLNEEHVPCVNDLSGSITAGVSGGVQPYVYEWSNGGSTATIDDLGAGHYVLTVSDARGCTATTEATLTITDHVPPVLVLQNVTVELNASGIATISANQLDAGSTDAGCGIASLTASASSFNCSQLGDHVVYVTATDFNGNTAQDSAVVTVEDNIAPQINCPAAITVGACQNAVQFNPPVVTDNCAVQAQQLSLVSGLPSGSVFPQGSTTETFSYTDAAGHEATCSFEIFVDEAIDAGITTTSPPCGGACDASATLVILGSGTPIQIEWSNGETDAMVNGLCAGDYAATVTDAHGCTTVETVTIQPVIDNEPPVLVLQNLIANLNTTGLSQLDAILFDAGSSDNCGIVSWDLSPSTFDCDDLGDQVVVLTATDASGNSASQTAIVTVLDNVVPTLTCPGNVYQGYCGAEVEFELPAIQDNCTVDPDQLVQLSGLPSGSQFPQGLTVQQFSYTDAAGNEAVCSFEVQVGTAPTIDLIATDVSCPGLCDGSAIVTVTGGSGPFFFLWGNGLTSDTLTGLCAGAYSGTVTDDFGCQETVSFTLSEPSTLSLNVNSVVNDLDDSGSGSISITMEGGTAPYTYAWTYNGQPFSTDEDLTGLHAGIYVVQVIDAHGCSLTSFELTVDNIVGTQEPNWASALSIRPNPANEFVEILTGTTPGQFLLARLYDGTGKLTVDTRIDTRDQATRLDVSALPAGVWILRLRAENGETIARRLVITH